MARIAKIEAREILDSRGNPTVEATVTLENGITAIASVPSGASTGTYETLELRDNDPKRYHGKGVLKAVKFVQTEIASALIGMDSSDQRGIDEKMIALDGTKNKARLGANAILGVSLASARATAIDRKLPLYQYLESLLPSSSREKTFPIPMFNVINGGTHADSGLSIQEFKIVPVGIKDYPEALRAGSEIFHTLQDLLRKVGYTTSVGDEGGFAPRLKSHAEAFELIVEAIRESGYEPGKDVSLDIDAAANSFYDRESDRYILQPENTKLSQDALSTVYKEWLERFPLFSIEDPFHEEDWGGWREFKKSLPTSTLIIGDDLLVTSVKRLEKAIQEDSCNAVLVKLNQIGTLSETLDCIALAKNHGMKTIISHRSGETVDDFIADLAVGAKTDFIKTGSLSRGERITKYNRLLAIYSERGD